jgi:hypothetical protein
VEQQGKDFVKDLGVNRKEMKKAAFSATCSIHGVVMLATLPVFGVMLIALIVSWNNNSFGIRNGMVTFLANHLFWFKRHERTSELTEANVARYCILIGYITARFWSTTVKSRHRSWKKATFNDGISSLE